MRNNSLPLSIPAPPTRNTPTTTNTILRYVDNHLPSDTFIFTSFTLLDFNLFDYHVILSFKKIMKLQEKKLAKISFTSGWVMIYWEVWKSQNALISQPLENIIL